MADTHRSRKNLLEYLRLLAPRGQWTLACDLYREALEEAKREGYQAGRGCSIADGANGTPAEPLEVARRANPLLPLGHVQPLSRAAVDVHETGGTIPLPPRPAPTTIPSAGTPRRDKGRP